MLFCAHHLFLFFLEFWDLPAGLYTFPKEFNHYVARQDAGVVLVFVTCSVVCSPHVRVCVGRIVLLDAADPNMDEKFFNDLHRKFYGSGSMILCGVVENKQQKRKIDKAQGQRYAYTVDHYCDYVEASLDHSDSVRRAVFRLIALLHTDGLKAAYGPI